MPFQLRQNLFWCEFAGRAVFLDVEADRYFCLPSDANAAFLRLATGDAEPRDAERLQMLISRGILIAGGTSATIEAPPTIEAAERDLLDEPHPSSGLYSVLRELVAEVLAIRLLRTREFSEVLEMVRRKGPKHRRPPRDPNSLLQAIAGASDAASYLMRVQDRCLVRALAVHRICKKYGIRPKLVFGVIAHPFAAHSWDQLGNKVVVGGFEHARLYTPILVLE